MANTQEVLSPSTALGQFNAILPTYGDGLPAILQTDANGRLLVSTDGGGIPLIVAEGPDYATVAAGVTNQALGAGGGATGDSLAGILIVPGTLSPGAVSVTDGSGSAITVFIGGAASISTLHPFEASWRGARSTSGAWKVTTGANVTVVAFGVFT